jgi:DNA-binding CsgD family transcriptional regulator
MGKLMSKEDLVKDLLKERFDITKPNLKQIEEAKKLFLQVRINRELDFDSKLSKGEVQCLFWIAHGYTAPKIARIMNKKLSTIESYQKELKRKLKCHTIAQAVYRGIEFGYIPPKPIEDTLIAWH